MIKQNRYDASTGTLAYTDEQREVYTQAVQYWDRYFHQGEAPGLPLNYISNPLEIVDLTVFFSSANSIFWAGKPKDPPAIHTFLISCKNLSQKAKELWANISSS